MNNIPAELLNKLNLSNYFFQTLEDTIEVIIISGDSVDNLEKFVDNLGGKYEDLGYGFGLVSIQITKIIALSLNEKIQYIELPKSLYLADVDSNSASCITSVQNSMDLVGKGVLMGFIDTGIDYTNNAFKNSDGTTRIEYIYDLNDKGVIYDKNQINEAINSPNPLDVVNSFDVVGHGTHVVGIACAGGKINKNAYGVAPQSAIAMVKVTRTQYALSTLIMRGLKFLVDKSKELMMPLVVNMSLSTNDGAHNGSSLLEKYIETLSTVERATIVVAAGNEGEAAHHISGELKSENEVSFNIGDDESIVVINLYKELLPKLTLELRSPDGHTTGIVSVVEGLSRGAIGDSRYQIFVTGPKPFDINGEVIIVISGISRYIVGGRWKIILRKIDDYLGNFDMWLPISEGLNSSTKFLNPTVDNTLGIPATVSNVISVGSYNYKTNTISPFSGRGKVLEFGDIKPDLVAPGEEIYSVVPNGSYEKKTGTSMAAPQVSGICALLMQWGIVNKNDPYLYGERLRYYLISGAKRRRRDIEYPDPAWGYGAVCMQDSINIVSRVINNLVRSEKKGNFDNKNYQDIKEKNTRNDSIENPMFILVQTYSDDKLNEIRNIPGVKALRISEQYALVITPSDKEEDIIATGVKVININEPSLLTNTAITPIEASGATTLSNNPYLRLNGRGVLIGIVDTGIDYLNAEFKKEDGTTRILSIWDQNRHSDKLVLEFQYGTEYTREEINAAIKLKDQGGDPYSIVDVKDEIGHGTMMAGIVGGRGINPELKGVASDVEFVIVKLAQSSKREKEKAYIESDTPAYNEWNVLLANRYINMIAKKEDRPVVIFIPLGGNIGAHSGLGVIENNINSISMQVGTVFVVPTGNQGDTETHTEGIVSPDEAYRDIEIRVGKAQKKLPIQIWINQPNRFKLSIISPSGEVIGDMTAKNTNERRIKFLYESTEMIVDITNPEPITGSGVMLIKANDLKEGIWKFRLIPEYIVDGKYYVWIPQRELLDSETRFLSPSESTTLTIPSTANGVISVAYYNQDNNSVVGASGRGFTTTGIIRPDIAAGGVNALVPVPGGGTKVITGSSVAGAVVAGSCALILQWAIVDGNDPELYLPQIRSYIISGAKTRPGDIYPNKQWGYGRFDLVKIFDNIREVYTPKSRGSQGYEEYELGNMYIRMPLK